MRVRDTGLIIGELAPGKLNKISDVPGVTVGHTTIDTPDHQTGVTVVMPCADNPFTKKLPCAGYVLTASGRRRDWCRSRSSERWKHRSP